MEHKDISVGLDIGTTKIAAMIGRRNEYGKIEILGIGKAKSMGVHRGVVNNITQTIQSIQMAVDGEFHTVVPHGTDVAGDTGETTCSMQGH